MKILGQYGTDNQYSVFAQPIHVEMLGNQLRDEDGLIVGLKDEYGDWVSPILYSYGIKSILKVEE